jgi:adenine-specific DNA-methyltransferase
MAKKKAAKKARKAAPSPPAPLPKGEGSKPKKRPIEQYDHSNEKRANNPPVGLVTPDTDPDSGRKTYQYDPHLDPQLAWAGKAEHTSFDVPTVSLHVHERIDPKTIIQAVRKINGNGNGGHPHPHPNPLPKGEGINLPSPKGEGINLPSPKGDGTNLPSPAGRGAGGEGPENPSPSGRGLGEGRRQQAFLFEHPAENPPLRDAIEFYKHRHNWSNRLIAGDSLLVMNSLLEKEGLGGGVQMIYIDPPYGIRYGSNFQPFVNKRDVKDGSDDDLTLEPETLKAFRDTWELGIHSYLTYLRDRLLLAKELLHESGSCFVQISDENIHHVREVMDEVFGVDNFVANLCVEKTAGQTSETIGSIVDYILFYAKDRSSLKYRSLYVERDLPSLIDTQFKLIESSDGSEIRPVREEMLLGAAGVPSGWRIFCNAGLTSRSASETTTFAYEFEGKKYRPYNGGWRTNINGMRRLESAGRLRGIGNSLMFKRFLDDFAYTPITNYWPDCKITGFTEQRTYVVQTPSKAIARCLLMTTDPGDLVLDPTCGSGTTAYVAEQWGRRWITTDTSRVAITLAKQRLMTATFDYYTLAHPENPHPNPLPMGEGTNLPSPSGRGAGGEGALGVKNGFVYKTVPHVTLKSIANNPEIKEGMTREQIDKAIAKYANTETLYDQPEVDNKTARVTGPFTVEAVPAAAVKPLDDLPLPPGEGWVRVPKSPLPLGEGWVRVPWIGICKPRCPALGRSTASFGSKRPSPAPAKPSARPNGATNS